MPSHPTVVSLLPSATEIVCAVGGEEQLVGVSHECDWPPSVVGRPVLTRALDLAWRAFGLCRIHSSSRSRVRWRELSLFCSMSSRLAFCSSQLE